MRNDVPALRRDRLSWIGQNYVRDETITPANARLVFGAERHRAGPEMGRR